MIKIKLFWNMHLRVMTCNSIVLNNLKKINQNDVDMITLFN